MLTPSVIDRIRESVEAELGPRSTNLAAALNACDTEFAGRGAFKSSMRVQRRGLVACQELTVRARRGMINFKDDRALAFDLAERLRVKRPDELAGQLSLLINGAFVSSQVLSPGEAGSLLQVTARALIAAARKP